MPFSPATNDKFFAKMAISGLAGTGKTYTSLQIAERIGNRVALVDSEYGTSKRYADLFRFDVCELVEFSIASYLRAIAEARQAKYDSLIIDSLTHCYHWEIEQANNSRNSIGKWAEMRPMERQLIQAILNYPGHVIATMREKPLYETLENNNGKKQIARVGVGPDQNKNIEYEFDIYGSLNRNHQLTIHKSRCSPLQDKVLVDPAPVVAEELNNWTGNPHRNWRQEQDALNYGKRIIPGKEDLLEQEFAAIKNQANGGKFGQQWLQRLDQLKSEEGEEIEF